MEEPPEDLDFELNTHFVLFMSHKKAVVRVNQSCSLINKSHILCEQDGARIKKKSHAQKMHISYGSKTQKERAGKMCV